MLTLLGIGDMLPMAMEMKMLNERAGSAPHGDAAELAERRDVTIVVINEDDGSIHQLPARRGEEIAHIIERMYRDYLRVERQADDRLRCDSNGEDVFQFSGLRLEQYLHQGRCAELRWVFTGGTGGA